MHSLAISIPIYKRPDLLDNCLASIVAELNANSDTTVWLFDDSCDDTNAGVIDKYRRQHVHIVHIRNEKNLGISANIHKALTETRADYVWLCGEDDLFVEGSLARIRGTIDHHAPAFIYVDYSYVSNDYSKITKKRVLDYPISGFVPARTFYEECSWAMGFIGSCIVSRDIIEKGCSIDYLDTYFNHVWIILRALPGNDFFIINEPLVLNRAAGGSSTTWSGQTFKVYEGYYIVLVNLGSVYGQHSRRKAIRSFNKRLGCFKFRTLIYCQVYDYFDKLTIPSILASKISLTHKIKTMAVLLIPKMTHTFLRWVIEFQQRVISEKSRVTNDKLDRC